MTSGPMAARFRDLAARLRAEPPLLGSVRLVAVDGRAGSGKTTFAAGLVRALRETGTATAEIHTDDLLPGWGALVSFWPRIEQQILMPLSCGRAATYHAYDWHAGRFSTDPREVAVPEVLVVEGVASAGACRRDRTTLAVRVDADRRLRLERGLSRDGEALRHQWLAWMEQEDSYFADGAPVTDASAGPGDRPGDRAEPDGAFDLIVSGAPPAGFDWEREYVVAGNDPWRAEI